MIDIQKVILIAKLAGIEILKYYTADNIDFKIKKDNSPLTKADEQSHKIICEELKKISNFPIFSEEKIIEYKERKNWNTFWLIDPLDGTKDFLAKNGQFTVNIALIKNNEPILGVVHIPFSNDTYYAQKNQGSFKNGQKIYNNSKRTDLIAANSNFYSTKEMEKFFSKHKITHVKKIGSSIKICLLAEGKIDVYPRLNETKEWDTAATHIIANEAGCKLVDIKTKKELIYNKEDYRNNFFIASRNDLEYLK